MTANMLRNPAAEPKKNPSRRNKGDIPNQWSSPYPPPVPTNTAVKSSMPRLPYRRKRSQALSSFFPGSKTAPVSAGNYFTKTLYLSHKQKVFVKIMCRSFLSLLKSRERSLAASATMDHPLNDVSVPGNRFSSLFKTLRRTYGPEERFLGDCISIIFSPRTYSRVLS